MLIGLTGTMAAGKGSLTKFLREKGFEGYVMSDIIREEAKKRGIEPTRENLQMIGNSLRKENNDEGVIAKKLIEKIKTSKAYIDGIRNTDEINELRHRKDFILIAIDAPQKLRYERLKKRDRPGDPKTFEQFKVLDDKENQESGKGQEIKKCIKLADYKIDNSKDLRHLKEQLDNIIF